MSIIHCIKSIFLLYNPLVLKCEASLPDFTDCFLLNYYRNKKRSLIFFHCQGIQLLRNVLSNSSFSLVFSFSIASPPLSKKPSILSLQGLSEIPGLHSKKAYETENLVVRYLFWNISIFYGLLKFLYPNLRQTPNLDKHQQIIFY